MSNNEETISEGSDGALNVGYGNFIVARRVVAILESGSLPVRRLREKAAGMNRLLDATSGRKMRSLIITDSNHVVLSALAPQTLQERLKGRAERSFHTADIEIESGEFVS